MIAGTSAEQKISWLAKSFISVAKLSTAGLMTTLYISQN